MASEFTTNPTPVTPLTVISSPSQKPESIENESVKESKQTGQATSENQKEGSPNAASLTDKPVDGSEIDRAVSRLKDYVQSLNRELQFTVDEESGKTVVKIIDGQSKEVVRQIPSDVLLQLANDMSAAKGLLLKEEA